VATKRLLCETPRNKPYLQYALFLQVCMLQNARPHLRKTAAQTQRHILTLSHVLVWMIFRGAESSSRGSPRRSPATAKWLILRAVQGILQRCAPAMENRQGKAFSFLFIIRRTSQPLIQPCNIRKSFVHPTVVPRTITRGCTVATLLK